MLRSASNPPTSKTTTPHSQAMLLGSPEFYRWKSHVVFAGQSYLMPTRYQETAKSENAIYSPQDKYHATSGSLAPLG